MSISPNERAGFLKHTVARRIRSLFEILPRSHKRDRKRPRQLRQSVTMRDGAVYRFWSDGSLRRHPPRPRGKALVKRLKRARQAARRAAA